MFNLALLTAILPLLPLFHASPFSPRTTVQARDNKATWSLYLSNCSSADYGVAWQTEVDYYNGLTFPNGPISPPSHTAPFDERHFFISQMQGQTFQAIAMFDNGDNVVWKLNSTVMAETFPTIPPDTFIGMMSIDSQLWSIIKGPIEGMPLYVDNFGRNCQAYYGAGPGYTGSQNLTEQAANGQLSDNIANADPITCGLGP